MERNASLDWLKLLMAVMIVGLHARFAADLSSLVEYLTVNGLFRIAVPVFYIISGFYFHAALESGRQKAWLRRVVILYLVWMAFYSPYWFAIPDASAAGLMGLMNHVAIGYHHLWYLPGLLGAAAMLTLFRRSGTPLLLAAIALTYLTGTGIQYAGNHHIMDDPALDALFNLHWFHRNFLLFSFPYFAIGHLIHRHALHETLSGRMVALLSVAGLAALLGESWLNFISPTNEGGFDNFATLIIACPAIFLSFIQRGGKLNGRGLALYSSALYFIHPFILNFAIQFTGPRYTLLSVVVLGGSLVASFLVIQLNRKLRFIL